MGAATGLHGGNLLGIFDVGNVEDAYAAETIFLRDGDATFLFFTGRRRRLLGKTLRPAIDAAIGHFHGHEEQIFVDGDVALSTGADQRGEQTGAGRVGNVKNIHAVKISLEEVVALKGKVGVGEG